MCLREVLISHARETVISNYVEFNTNYAYKKENKLSFLPFSSRQHAWHAYAISRPSLPPSVCFTGGSIKNGWS